LRWIVCHLAQTIMLKVHGTGPIRMAS
jgi:hypothetical protein